MMRSVFLSLAAMFFIGPAGAQGGIVAQIEALEEVVHAPWEKYGYTELQWHVGSHSAIGVAYPFLGKTPAVARDCDEVRQYWEVDHFECKIVVEDGDRYGFYEFMQAPGVERICSEVVHSDTGQILEARECHSEDISWILPEGRTDTGSGIVDRMNGIEKILSERLFLSDLVERDVGISKAISVLGTYAEIFRFFDPEFGWFPDDIATCPEDFLTSTPLKARSEEQRTGCFDALHDQMRAGGKIGAISTTGPLHFAVRRRCHHVEEVVTASGGIGFNCHVLIKDTDRPAPHIERWVYRHFGKDADERQDCADFRVIEVGSGRVVNQETCRTNRAVGFVRE